MLLEEVRHLKQENRNLRKDLQQQRAQQKRHHRDTDAKLQSMMELLRRKPDLASSLQSSPYERASSLTETVHRAAAEDECISTSMPPPRTESLHVPKPTPTPIMESNSLVSLNFPFHHAYAYASAREFLEVLPFLSDYYFNQDFLVRDLWCVFSSAIWVVSSCGSPPFCRQPFYVLMMPETIMMGMTPPTLAYISPTLRTILELDAVTTHR